MPSDLSFWSPLKTAASTLSGVVLTFAFTARNMRSSRNHERAMRHEEWEHVRAIAERQKRREVYEGFLASIDASERAVAMMHSGRQSGIAIDKDPDIAAAAFNATAHMYEARSLLSLYGPNNVASAGDTLSAQVLDINTAYGDFERWKRDLYGFKDQFAIAVRGVLDAPLESAVQI